MVSNFKGTKGSNLTKVGKGALADVAILSMTDLERIKKCAIVLTKDEERNQHKIQQEQKEIREAAAKVK